MIFLFGVILWVGWAQRKEDRYPLQTFGQDKETVHEYLLSLLGSEGFLTVIREVIPAGSDDEETGFYQIPTLLLRIEDRRKRFEKSSRRFLRLTIGLGFFLGAVMIVLSYLLINEAAAGLPKDLARLEREAGEIRQSLDILIPSYTASSDFQKRVGIPLKELLTARPAPTQKQLSIHVDSAINAAQVSGNYAALVSVLDSATSLRGGASESNLKYYAAMQGARQAISKYLRERDAAIPRIAASLDKIEDVLPRLDAKFETAEFRVPELIKRVALGLIVATFFLAILRYIASIYERQNREMISAERDDLAVRKLAIALKNTAASEEQRKAVLTTWLSESGTTSPEHSGEIGLTKSEADLVRSMLEAVSKKL